MSKQDSAENNDTILSFPCLQVSRFRRPYIATATPLILSNLNVSFESNVRIQYFDQQAFYSTVIGLGVGPASSFPSIPLAQLETSFVESSPPSGLADNNSLAFGPPDRIHR